MTSGPDEEQPVVRLTAIAVAAGRAVEASRPDALVHDPFAGPLVHAFEALTPEGVDLPTTWPESFDDLPPGRRRLLLTSVYVGLRTRFVDDYITGLRPDADPVPEVDRPRQVVILGAGLDTRAFRLDWPGRTELYELDTAEVLVLKRDLLRTFGAEPLCEWSAVPVDLAHAWELPLVAAGFDRRRRTTWIVEGLLPLLPAEAQREAIATIARLSVPGSCAVVERAVGLDASPEIDERLRLFGAETGMPMDDFLARAHPPDPAGLLRERGWTVAEHTAHELAVRYGRSLDEQDVVAPGAGGDMPVGTFGSQAGAFITAELEPPPA